MNFINKLNIADYYIWIYLLYFCNGILYPYGVINIALNLLFIAYFILLGFKYLFYKPSYPAVINITALLIWMYIIYGAILILENPILVIRESHVIARNHAYLQNSLLSLSPILVSYYLFQKKYLTVEKLRVYIIPFLILFIIRYFKYEMDILSVSGAKETTNNVGYSFCAFIPFIFLMKKKWLRYTILITSIMFIFASFKRGAILTGSLVIILIGYYLIFKTKNIKRKIISMVMVSVFAIGMATYVINLYNESPYFQMRVKKTEKGDASNREDIYGEIWETYLQGNTLQILFGRGASSTLNTSSNYAHEDWLETLHNNGIIGGLILAAFYLSILISIRKISPYIDLDKKIIFGALFITCFMPTFFSMSIQNMSLPQSILIGYLAYIVRQVKRRRFPQSKVSKVLTANALN